MVQFEIAVIRQSKVLKVELTSRSSQKQSEYLDRTSARMTIATWLANCSYSLVFLPRLIVIQVIVMVDCVCLQLPRSCLLIIKLEYQPSHGTERERERERARPFHCCFHSPCDILDLCRMAVVSSKLGTLVMVANEDVSHAHQSRFV